jgi:hypothetical protein
MLVTRMRERPIQQDTETIIAADGPIVALINDIRRRITASM